MPVLPLPSATLRDGAELRLSRIVPPVGGGLADEIHAFINNDLCESYHRDCLAGEMDADEAMRYFTGRVGGGLAGTCWYSASPAWPAAGCLAGVATAPAMRRKGVAWTLCEAALRDFEDGGGAAMYLAYANDIARAIYERMGFVVLLGRVMRRAPAGRDFDAECFGPARDYRIVEAAWSDMARIVPLLVYPHEWELLDAKAALRSQRYQPGKRCIGLFVDVWLAVALSGGVWRLLEADGGRVVGGATLYPETPTGGVCDFLLHANHFSAAPRLLADLFATARQRGLTRLDLRLSPRDDGKLRLARAAGFAPASDQPLTATGLLTCRREIGG